MRDVRFPWWCTLPTALGCLIGNAISAYAFTNDWPGCCKISFFQLLALNCLWLSLRLTDAATASRD
jgi:hypothetical protein